MNWSLFYETTAAKAFWFGIISAAALPLGAFMGITLRPRKRIVAAIMAFGAGSLLAALTLELVAGAFALSGFTPLAIGAVIGGVLFVLLNQILNGQGAFLRKPATIVKYLLRTKRDRLHHLIEHLSKVELLASLPTAEMATLMPHIGNRHFSAGHMIFKQGDLGDSLYLIESGEVQVMRDDTVVATLKDGDSFGEMSLLSGATRNATLQASTDLKAWEILKDDFDTLRKNSPALIKALQDLSDQRMEENRENKVWQSEMDREVEGMDLAITNEDVQEASTRHKGAAFAIWLGIALDGIPESAVIGASTVHASVSWALLVGLFLSNLPEAMSSAVGMRAQRSSIFKIMAMWTSLMVLTGVGALLGNIFFVGASPFWFSAFEGCAAGAMLVMIAETMLPEAYEQGGAVVGMSTLFGFLTALFVKSLGTGAIPH